MKKLLIAISVLALMPACKKDEGSSTTNLTVNSTNITGVYKITSMTFTASGSTTAAEIFTIVTPACRQDDTHHFTAANTYFMTDAGVACTPSSTTTPSPYTISGSTSTFGGQTYTIESITQTGSTVKMVVSANGNYTTPLGPTAGLIRTTFTR